MDKKLILEKTIDKLRKTHERVGDKIAYRTINGQFEDMTDRMISWWTNGFWPGLLWLAYIKTGENEFMETAKKIEEKLDRAFLHPYGIHHDVGFIWKLSSVANYKLNKDPESARRGYLAASLLASKFNPKGNFLRAWPEDCFTGWAIIDCMMNIPILYWADNYYPSPNFTNIANAHADTVMQNFIYEDGSSKHICEFNPVTGEYVKNFKGQGYSEDSAWSRGAAWAFYGFVLAYKYTNNFEYLKTAEKCADFWIKNLPDDYVPFSDFKAPAEEQIFRDTSAAACAASGFTLLSRLINDNAKKELYNGMAEKMTTSLYENYTDWENDEALLIKGCTEHPKDFAALNPDKNSFTGYETSLIYGDFFFMEALMRLNGYDGLFE